MDPISHKANRPNLNQIGNLHGASYCLCYLRTTLGADELISTNDMKEGAFHLNPLAPKDIYIYIYIYMS